MKRTNTAQWDEKRKNWRVAVQKDGQRRNFYSSIPGRTGQREANAKADAWLDDNIENDNERVSKLYDAFVDNLKLTTTRPHWIKIESFGANWIKPEIGHIRISRIGEMHLQTIIDKAYAAGRAKKTLSSLRTAITSFIKYCRLSKATTLIPENLSIPKGARTGKRRILQPDGLIALFSIDTVIKRGKNVPDPYINAYRFQVLTGLRPGELMGLMWNDIDGNTVNVRRSINSTKEITKGKNENAVRHFVMTAQAKAVLDSQRKDLPYVFGIVSLSSYEKRWRRYCESNNIPYVSLYEMRHTFVSIANTLPAGRVKQIVGHSKNFDTFGVYGHEIKGDLEQTAADITARFAEILKKE